MRSMSLFLPHEAEFLKEMQIFDLEIFISKSLQCSMIQLGIKSILDYLKFAVKLY